MAELHHGKRRQCHIDKRKHLITHGVGIEFTAYRTLHPGICHQNPPCRDGCTKPRQPCGGEMESTRDFVPTKIHHCHKGALHEKSDNALYGQRCTEDVANEPRIVAPVGSKLKFEDDTCRYTHSEIDSEKLLPEFSRTFPE